MFLTSFFFFLKQTVPFLISTSTTIPPYHCCKQCNDNASEHKLTCFPMFLERHGQTESSLHALRICKKKKKKKAGCQWHTPVILATQEAEIRMIVVWCQPRQRVLEVLAQKHPSQKRAGRVAQGEGPEFKPQHWKKKKEGEESQIQPALLSPYFIISWLSSYLSCLVYRYSLITVLTSSLCRL
jgi:hypothetical protein